MAWLKQLIVKNVSELNMIQSVFDEILKLQEMVKDLQEELSYEKDRCQRLFRENRKLEKDNMRLCYELQVTRNRLDPIRYSPPLYRSPAEFETDESESPY